MCLLLTGTPLWAPMWGPDILQFCAICLFPYKRSYISDTNDARFMRFRERFRRWSQMNIYVLQTWLILFIISLPFLYNLVYFNGQYMLHKVIPKRMGAKEFPSRLEYTVCIAEQGIIINLIFILLDILNYFYIWMQNQRQDRYSAVRSSG